VQRSLGDRLMDVVDARIAAENGVGSRNGAQLLADSESDAVGPHPEQRYIRFDRGTWVVSWGRDLVVTVDDKELQPEVVDSAGERPAA
jgi:hypothetical protein